MAIANSLPIGVTTQITQNVAYALPARAVYVTSGAALESAPTDTGPWTAQAAGIATAAFVRCPTANTTVSVKAL